MWRWRVSCRASVVQDGEPAPGVDALDLADGQGIEEPERLALVRSEDQAVPGWRLGSAQLHCSFLVQAQVEPYEAWLRSVIPDARSVQIGAVQACSANRGETSMKTV